MSALTARKLSDALEPLWDLSPRRFRKTIRAAVRSMLGDASTAVWAPWLELAATEYLFIGFESNNHREVTAQLSSICARAAGVASDAHGPAGTPFPGASPLPYWSTWQSVNEPPPLRRTAPVAPCPRQPEWEAAAYDLAAWDVLYDVTVRITHIGNFDRAGLYPLAGVDPVILRDGPAPRLDHALPGGTRPPMGFAVACLLTRQLAYDYGSDHGEYPIAAWIFARLEGVLPSPGTYPPAWLTESLCEAFAALEPGAMLAFCKRAINDFDRRWDKWAP